MYKIPTKVQKIIMFIPRLNMFVFFIWVFNFYSYYRIGLSLGEMAKVGAKSLLVIFASAIPVIIILNVINSVAPGLSTILNWLVTYLPVVAMGAGLVWYQEKLA